MISTSSGDDQSGFQEKETPGEGEPGGKELATFFHLGTPSYPSPNANRSTTPLSGF